MVKKVVVWGLGVDFSRLWKYYKSEADKGTMEIIGLIGTVRCELPKHAKNIPIISKNSVNQEPFDYLIVSSSLYYKNICKEAIGLGISPGNIIDGMAFASSAFDFAKFASEDLSDIDFSDNIFSVWESCLHKRIFRGMSGIRIALGMNSYVINAVIQGHIVPDCYHPNVEIGNFSSISGDNVWEIGTGVNHDYCSVSTSPYFFEGEPNLGGNIVIGSDVWIGKGCHIKSFRAGRTLTIGNGAVVASDSVIVDDVPSYAIVGGNPARIIKYRFSQPMIEAFERIRWWDWHIDKIDKNRQYFSNPELFIKAFDI